MGHRTVMRVPLDFDWPLNTIWKGYLNPYSPTECLQCNGSGQNPETKKISDDWYSHNRDDGVEGWQHSLNQEEVDALWERGRLKSSFKEKPTAEQVNEWSRIGIGHDAVNHWICVEVRAKRYGVYGKCPLCKGNGHYWCDDKYEELWDGWEDIEPPTGEGWQLWETTSEGSPTSPVFETAEALAEWCVDNATFFASIRGTYVEWLRTIKGDTLDADSLAITSPGMGVTVLAKEKVDEDVNVVGNRVKNIEGSE